MRDQPIPDSSRWPWNSEIWRVGPAESFAAVHIMDCIRDDCTFCGAMIFPGELACEVVLRAQHGWHMLHFHQHCYVDWQH